MSASQALFALWRPAEAEKDKTRRLVTVMGDLDIIQTLRPPVIVRDDSDGWSHEGFQCDPEGLLVPRVFLVGRIVFSVEP